MSAGALSVTQYLDVVNATLATIPPEALVIEGEVADYRLAQEKWITFLLKDELTGDKLPCFATIYNRLPPLQEGLRIQVQGVSKINGRFGKYSLNVTAATLVGEGALKQAYEALKKRLESEGLFAFDRKRPLPLYPERVGLITSREAAAYGDFLRILNNRWPGLEVLHVHTQVQGQGAVEQIVSAFNTLNALPPSERPEVIVLTRGGGAFEELHAFNDERVARAVYASTIPVLVGVGHERDETLVDFVADVRASTPSNAAERLVPDRRYLLDDLERMFERWRERIDINLRTQERLFDRFTQAATFITGRAAQQLRRTEEILVMRANFRIRTYANQLTERSKLLSSYDPRQVLLRGYAIARAASGQALRSIHQAPPGTPLEITLSDGTLEATVNPKQTALL